MRRTIGWAVALLVTGSVISCTDAPSATTSRQGARLAFVPQFTGAAAEIFQRLPEFALAVDNVHVTVRALVGDGIGDVLEDTTIAFPVTADEIRIVIDLALPARVQDVIALVELREGATVYFEGEAFLVARVGETAGTTEPIAMSYVGPGATAAFLSLNRSQATLAPSAAYQLSVTAYDASERVVTNLPITWSTSDATVATVTLSGTVTSTGKVGTATIIAKGLNGLSAEMDLAVRPVARLEYVTGDAQTGLAGAVLGQPFQVRAFSTEDDAVIGASITFSAVSSGGTVSPATTTTDDNGLASATITLGAAIGSYTFRATVTGSPNVPPVSIGAAAVAGAAAAIAIVSGNNQTEAVDATLQPLVLLVKDALGNPVSGATVQWQVAQGSALLYPDPIPDVSGVTTLASPTGTDGTSRVRVVIGTLAGPVVITASVPGTSISAVSFALTALPGPVAQLVVIQQPSRTAQATIKLAQQPRVQLADQYGNPIRQSGFRVAVRPSYFCEGGCVRSGYPLARASRDGAPLRTARATVPTTISRSASISDTITYGVVGDTLRATDANGVATFTDLALNMYRGTYALEFYDPSDGPAYGVTDVIDLAPGPATSLVALEDTIDAVTGATVTPYVRVQDAVGNGIAGVKLYWDTKAGTQGRIDSATTTTDGDGYSTPGNWALPATTGFFQLIVTPLDGLKLENVPLPIVAHVIVIGDAGGTIQSFEPGRSKTGFPPTTVMTIFASRIDSGGMRVRSRSMMTKSASMPVAIVPLSLSANSA